MPGPHDSDVLPGEAPGGTSSFDDRESAPPVTLGPYTVQYIGLQKGQRTLRINVGRHTIRIYAEKRGIAAQVSVEIDGRRLVKKRVQRKWRIWSRDILIKRWIVGSAAEFVDDQPRWSYDQIAANLARSGRAKMHPMSVWRLVRRFAPELADRRAAYYNADPRRKSLPKKMAVPTNNPWKKKKAREAVRAELKKAGLL